MQMTLCQHRWQIVFPFNEVTQDHSRTLDCKNQLQNNHARELLMAADARM